MSPADSLYSAKCKQMDSESVALDYHKISKHFKSCFVPKCRSTTVRTPEKMFFSIKKERKTRLAWFKAARRELNVAPTTTLYCCEDHFNVKEDVDNLLQYQLLEGRVKLRLKSGVVPHTFECQKDRKRASTIQPKPYTSRKRFTEVEENLVSLAVSNDGESLTSKDITSCIKTINDELNEQEVAKNSSFQPEYTSESVLTNSKPEDHNKHASCTVDSKLIVTSSIKHVETTYKKPSPFQIKPMLLDNLEGSDSNLDSDFVPEFEVYPKKASTPLKCDEISSEELDRQLSLNVMTRMITEDPEMFLGIPRNRYFILLEHINAPVKNIHLTLMKIRLNDSFSRLAKHFGMSTDIACSIFQKTVSILSEYFKNLIFWPSNETIKRNLPELFRQSHCDVESIIDCFEIEIEKLSNPVHQKLTWSESSNCNTVKYLISSTPDGFINFISDGYGGRIADCYLLDDSNFLRTIPVGCSIMADSSIKNVATLISSSGCNFIKPVSVYQNKKPSDEEGLETKEIFLNRIHSEQIIQRLREFAILKKHSVIDVSNVYYLDDIVNVICGITNLHNPIVKTRLNH